MRGDDAGQAFGASGAGHRTPFDLVTDVVQLDRTAKNPYVMGIRAHEGMGQARSVADLTFAATTVGSRKYAADFDPLICFESFGSHGSYLEDAPELNRGHAQGRDYQF